MCKFLRENARMSMIVRESHGRYFSVISREEAYMKPWRLNRLKATTERQTNVHMQERQRQLEAIRCFDRRRVEPASSSSSSRRAMHVYVSRSSAPGLSYVPGRLIDRPPGFSISTDRRPLTSWPENRIKQMALRNPKQGYPMVQTMGLKSQRIIRTQPLLSVDLLV